MSWVQASLQTGLMALSVGRSVRPLRKAALTADTEQGFLLHHLGRGQVTSDARGRARQGERRTSTSRTVPPDRMPEAPPSGPNCNGSRVVKIAGETLRAGFWKTMMTDQRCAGSEGGLAWGTGRRDPEGAASSGLVHGTLLRALTTQWLGRWAAPGEQQPSRPPVPRPRPLTGGLQEGPWLGRSPREEQVQ